MNLLEKIRFRTPFLAGLLRPSSFPYNPLLFSTTISRREILQINPKRLRDGFRKFGSDKSTFHDYHIPYSWILERLDSPGSILEIGIGTNDPSLPSTMGKNGQPGASLRAWRAIDRFQHVVGADIDRNCLFQENGISTFYVNQLSDDTLDALVKETQNQFSFILIIDDGLHTTEANIHTFDILFPILEIGGYYVIEDIRESDFIDTFNQIASRIDLRQISIWANPAKSSDNTLIIISKLV